MANVTLSDKFGISIDVEPRESSSVAKYFKEALRLRFDEFNLASLKDTRLENLPVAVFNAGISVEQPVDVGPDAVELTLGAGLHAGIECVVARNEDRALFDSDLYGDPVRIPKGQAYMSFNVEGSVQASLAGKPKRLTFGIDSGRNLAVTHYQPFDAKQTVLQALRQTFQDFVIPADLDDLAAMSDGSIATVEGKGTLTCSGEVNLLSVTNPLYSASLPADLGKIAVKAKASVSIGARFEFTGTYQVRVHKTSASTYRIGYYRRRESELEVKASATAGISGKIRNSDLIAKLIHALSPDPETDRTELENAGLDENRIQAMDSAIKAGLERNLEVALRLEIGMMSSHTAVFLYDVDQSKLDEQGRLAIHSALAGDLGALTKSDESLPAGITLVKSVLTSLRRKTHTFKVNLLGIYNFISVSKLMAKGVVLYDPLTGELTITDTVTASRIRASLANFASETDKLREVLSEHFLITALYRCTKLAAAPPAITSTHSYFERHARTNRQTMKDNCDIAEAMRLISGVRKQEILGERDDFGPSLLVVDTTYDDERTRSLFLKNGVPRSEAEYDKIGREALGLLIQIDDADAYRRIPVVDDPVWENMKRVGQAGFRTLFPRLTNEQVAVIRSDYSVISWWSQTMHRMAVELGRLEEFFAASSNPDPDGDQFKNLRKELAKLLEAVAKNTREQFGDPWGLVAMDIAAGRQAGARFRLTSSGLSSLDLERASLPS